MVTVEADIITPNDPVVLNNVSCVVERDTSVVCFDVSVCFHYSLLPGDLVERFSKKLAVTHAHTHTRAAELHIVA